MVKDFKKHLPEDELGGVSAKVEMCVDAFATIEKLEPKETQDEIECLEITKQSDNNFSSSCSSCLNIDLLDEIDEVLETNAEDFVKSYVQKGGQ